MMDYWLLAVAVLLLLVILYFYGTSQYGTLKGLGLQGPKPYPFLGNFLEIHQKQIFNFNHEYTLKYGKLWTCYDGRLPIIVIAEPEMLREILVKQFNNFVNRDMPIRYRVRPKGVFSAFDGDWKRIRTILTPTFSTLRMKQMLPLIHSSADTLVQIFDEAADSGKSTDVSKIYGRFTMEVILSAAFGVLAESQRDPDDRYTALAAQIFEPDSSFMFQLLRSFPPLLFLFVPFSNIRAAFQSLNKIAMDIICARRSTNTVKRKDLLQLMLMSSGEEGEAKDPSKTLSDDEMTAQSVTFLLAGYETTSTTLSFVTFALATNPDVQERLLSEIDELVPGDQVPDYDQLQSIPYLDMVINETLRVYPPVHRLDRVAKQDCVINGQRIPKNVMIRIPTYSIHRDPEYWPAPEKFDPMRFSPEAKAKQHPYAFLPFGGGPRNCIGMRFALMEAKLALVMLLKKFKFERAPDTEDPLTLRGSITMCPANGCYVYIKHRQTKGQ